MSRRWRSCRETRTESTTGKRSSPVSSSRVRIEDAIRLDESLWVETLGPLVVAASQPWLDQVFGDDGPSLVARWVVWPSSELYAGRARVAIEGDLVLGALIALPGAELAAARHAEAIDALRVARGSPGSDRSALVAASAEVPEDALFISTIAVHPARRGGGVGRALVLDAVERARRDGRSEVRLDVHEDNVSARALFSSLGFVPVGGETSPSGYVALRLRLLEPADGDDDVADERRADRAGA